jgi:integrase/recombinase XerC
MKCLVERAWARIAPEQPGIQVPCDPSFLSRRDLAIIEVLFATGMRVGELVTLNLSDWSDEDESFIVKGKGLRQRLAILPDKRSSMAVRDYMARRMPLCLTHSALFINAYGERLAAQGVGRMLAKIADEARITERVTPHMIRHTVATLLLRLGADIRVVQEVLGHTSITTTQRYTHITKEHLRSTLGLHHPSHHLNIDTKRCF